MKFAVYTVFLGSFIFSQFGHALDGARCRNNGRGRFWAGTMDQRSFAGPQVFVPTFTDTFKTKKKCEEYLQRISDSEGSAPLYGPVNDVDSDSGEEPGIQ
jgi:hypothetical protein